MSYLGGFLSCISLGAYTAYNIMLVIGYMFQIGT